METRGELAVWLDRQMKERNWSIRETARRANLSHPLVSDILKGLKPTAHTCKALAGVFGEKDITVMRMAGIVDSEPDTDPWVETQKHKLARLRPSLRDVAANVLNSLLDQQDREQAEKEKTDRGKTRPARP